MAEEETLKRINGQIQISVIQMDVVNDVEKPAISVRVQPQATHGELLSLISDKLELESHCIGGSRLQKIQCAKISDGEVNSVLLWSNDRNRIFEWIQGGDILYVAMDTTNNRPSVDTMGFNHKLQKMATNIIIRHNKLKVNDDDINDKHIFYDQKLSVDITMKVITLKSKMCQKFGIPLNEVILRKGYHGQALRDNHRTLKQYNIHRNKIIYVERGKLTENEFIFQIFVQNEIKQRYILWGWIRENIIVKQIIPDSINDLIFEYYYIQKSDDPLIYVNDVKLHKDWRMSKIKNIISKQCIGKVPKISRMRIREFVNDRLTRLYYDDKTLSQNCGSSIKDYKQICVQRKWRKNEEDMTKKHILLNCVRWYPKKKTLGPMIEFAFLKKTKIKKDLKIELRDISGIDGVYLEYTLVPGYKLKEFDGNRPRGHWQTFLGAITTDSTLVSRPWKCKQGDILLYFDNREF